MKKILYILCFILTGSSAFLVSCDKPEELTPKVDNTSEDYTSHRKYPECTRP